MKQLLVLITILLVSCTSIEFKASNPTDTTTVITGIEKSLFDEQEKLKITLSEENGGHIKSIAWNGKKLLQEPVAENFPNKENDYKKQRALFIDDNSGLLIVDVRQRTLYQFRRSYNVYFNNLTEEYVVEVIYNVKNHSSDKDLKYKWNSFMELKNKPKHYRIAGDWTSENLKKISHLDTPLSGQLSLQIPGEEELQLKIKASEIIGLTLDLDNQGQKAKFGHRKEFTLKTKERISWKVKYFFKETL